MIDPRISGLYAVTPETADTFKLFDMVEAALRGGAAAIQYRNKSANAALRIEQARALQDLCRQHGVALIINDYIELCLILNADGVHLGGDDGDIAAARMQLGPSKIIGVSCYNCLKIAAAAKSQGADYVAFGACFDSATKPATVRAPLALLTQAREKMGLPVVAIGGITLANATLAIEAGADAIAVIAAVFMASDVQLAAQQFSNLFNPAHHHDLTQSATI